MYKAMRQALETPFDKKLIKQRKGNGRMLDYIEADVILKRVNDIFDSNWNFEILTKPTDAVVNGHVVVQVRVTVPHMVEEGGKIVQDGYIQKDAYGGKKITIAVRDGSFLDLASDIKAASVDGCKKAFTMLGVALDLYGSDDTKEDVKEEDVASEPKKVITVGTVDNPVSPQQLSAINTMVKAKKVDDLGKFVKDVLKIDIKVEDLKESQAKLVITSLNSYTK